MQPTEGFNIPRRTLDVEDYIDILRRHKGWIFGPFLFCLVASVVGAYLWPDTYISEGIIKVEPQQLPTNLVQGVMTQDIIDQIQSMTEQIESRAILTNVVNTYNLYLKERSREPMEDVLATMQKAIKIEPLGVNTNGHTVPAFKVSFSYPDRRQAMKVTEDLISKFIEASTRDESSRATQLTQFLQHEQEEAGKELEAVETQLTAYKMQNNGALPEQKSENYQKLQLLEQSRSNIQSQLSQLQTEKLFAVGALDQINQTAETLSKIKPDAASAQQQKSPKLQQADAQVDALDRLVRELLQKYTESYPDVKAAKAQLAEAIKERDQLAQDEANKKDPATGQPTQNIAVIKDELDRKGRINQLQMQIQADDTRMEDLRGQLKNLESQANRMQALLNGVPQSEKEYEDLVRERDLKKERYEQATKNLSQGQVTQEMENRQEGENLQILDPASDPETPAYPNHAEIVGIGAGVGLLLGIVIAGAREMKDTSLKNLKDVRAYTQLPVLGSIPLLENDFVVRRRRRLAWLGWTTACLAAAVLMSGSIAYYVFTTKGQ